MNSRNIPEQPELSKVIEYVSRYPEMLRAIYDVLKNGALKYDENGWLQEDGKTMSKKANFDCKNHHAAKHFAGQYCDVESGLYHLAHEGVRALMELTRLKRHIIHPDDKLTQSCTESVNHCWRLNTWSIDDSKCLTPEEAVNKYRGSQYMKAEDNNMKPEDNK